MLAEKVDNKEVCVCMNVCGIQLEELGDDWKQGFIPLPPFPKEREQKAGQKHLWPMTPVIIPTPPCYVRAVVCLARGPWGYGASTQSISTCHHPVDIRVFVFPVSHPLGGSCQVCNWSFFTFLIFSYFMLCYETQWRLFSEWFWLSPCPDWNFI